MDDGRGLRSVLQPILYFGLASMLHGLLFLIPGGGPAKREPETTRGIRVKTFVEARATAEPPSNSPPPPTKVLPTTLPQPPAAVRDQHYSAMGSRSASGDSADTGAQDSGARAQGASTAGDGGPSPVPEKGRQGPPAQSDYGLYLERLHSSGVQQWAKDSAQKTWQGWRGTGVGTGSEGWGKDSKTGIAAGGGKGRGSSGAGSGGDGALYMDPRVRMVVKSYPATSIEQRFTPVRYPDLKFKRHQYTAGWWNVYIELTTAKDGSVTSLRVLRPETDGPVERQFVAQVRKEVEKWTFEPKAAEIHVDVRFYLE